jgi:hypothetical protein
METHHSNARLSIYRMGDTSAFVMGDGMGDASAFVIKEDMPLTTCIFFTCIIGDV